MISTLIAGDTGTAALSGAATAGLLVLLVAGELADAGQGEFLKTLRRNLWVFALPLLVVFAAIVIVACVEIVT